MPISRSPSRIRPSKGSSWDESCGHSRSSIAFQWLHSLMPEGMLLRKKQEFHKLHTSSEESKIKESIWSSFGSLGPIAPWRRCTTCSTSHSNLLCFHCRCPLSSQQTHRTCPLFAYKRSSPTNSNYTRRFVWLDVLPR